MELVRLIGGGELGRYAVVDAEGETLAVFRGLADAGLCFRFLTGGQMGADDAARALALLDDAEL